VRAGCGCPRRGWPRHTGPSGAARRQRRCLRAARGVSRRGRAYCSPELARELYERKPGDKEILWMDADQHIDLYDMEPHVSQAAQATADSLHRNLRAW